MADANPISGPYTNVPATTYHQNHATYNRTVLVTTNNFLATGSNANPIAFYVTGSVPATVNLVNGGSITIPAPSGTAPAAIYELGVYSVTSGSVYLLYKS